MLLLAILFAIGRPTPPRPVQEIAARQMLGNFVAGRFDEASKDFNETMRATAPPSVLANMKKRMEAEVGAFQHIAAVHKRTEDGFPAVELVLKYDKAPVSMVVVFDRSNRIGAVTMHPVVPEPVNPELEAAARELLANFTARRFAEMSARFDATMQAQLPPGRLAGLYKDVAVAFGAFRAITAVRQETAQQFRVIDMTASFELDTATVRVVFDQAGKIAGLYIRPFDGKSPS